MSEKIEVLINLGIEADGSRSVEVWVKTREYSYLAAQVRGAATIQIKYPKGWPV